MKRENKGEISDYPYFLVQDERQAALAELNTMEKRHRELQVLFFGSS